MRQNVRDQLIVLRIRSARSPCCARSEVDVQQLADRAELTQQSLNAILERHLVHRAEFDAPRARKVQEAHRRRRIVA